MSASLFERLGGTETITLIAGDIVDLHQQNPRISPRFAASNPTVLKKAVAAFFSTGTGGPAIYEGKDMLATHKGMNIDNDEFVAVLDDVLKAMDNNGIGQREQEEVLFVLFSMRGDVVAV